MHICRAIDGPVIRTTMTGGKSMKEISRKIYSLIVTATALFAFGIWNVMNNNKAAIEKLLSNNESLFYIS